MKRRTLIPLLLVPLLVSCTGKTVTDRVYFFDTVIDYKLIDGKDENCTEINAIFKDFDAFSDNYHVRAGIINVSTINVTNEEITVDPALYELLKTSFSTSEIEATFFNPLCGSLSKAWKEALANKEVLSEATIAGELSKMNSTSLVFKENNVVQRVGEATIDLGGIAKGYALDKVQEYLVSQNEKHYLVNAGYSSILLGEKDTDNGYFTVGIDSRIIPNSYLKLKNCFVSTSSITEQGVKISEGGPTYSHIINPVTGSAINKHDAVIVVSSKGYIGDVLSTSMMNNEIDEIKAIEASQNVKCIVIDNKEVTYINNELEVLHR